MIFIVFLFLILMVFLIFIIIDIGQLQNQRNRQKNLNLQVIEKLKQLEFNADKVFYLVDRATDNSIKEEKQMIFVNTNVKKIAFCDYESNNICIVNFSEVLDFEIYKNGSTFTTGAKIGGLGALFGAETDKNCRQLKLIIKLKIYDKSQITYTFIDNPYCGLIGISETSRVYQDCIASIQKLTSFLEILKEENKKM